MEPARSRSGTAAPWVATLVVLLLGATLVPPEVEAQNLSCLNCDFELVIIDWNGSAFPGTVATGVLEIRNTGQSSDSYAIAATVDNDTWGVETDTDATGSVPPGSGPFADDNNRTNFKVRLLVPDDAPAGGKVTVTVEVTSQNDDGLVETERLEGRAKQVYDWTLDCTPSASAQKSKRTDVFLTANNRGNGRDRATVSYTPAEGLVVTDPQTFELGAGQTAQQSIEIGVGLRAEDGTTNIRWDLRSRGDPQVLAQCTTAFEIAGGEDADPEPTGDGEDEDSPGPALPVLLLVLGMAAWLHRRRPPTE